MITFWVNRAGSAGISRYCHSRGHGIADRIRAESYEDIATDVRLHSGPHIFSAIDQLTPAQREIVAHLWNCHAESVPSAVRLNDPRRVLLRFALLKELHERGVNSFAVYPATEPEAIRQYPVFVREYRRHNGPRTTLLESRLAVERALVGLTLRGVRRRDLMIVEFCDTRDRDGLFRKYAAYKVGPTILPCHVLRSHRWWAKSTSHIPDEAGIHEEARYVQDNPHREWLQRVFDIAGIDYGRIDYGIRNGSPQVWEINLNPTLGTGASNKRNAALTPALRELREQYRFAFHQRLQAAFVALDGAAAGEACSARVDPALIERARAEMTERKRQARGLKWLLAVPDALRVGEPVRAAYFKLFPRR
jgi:hypothetical protein